MRNEKKIPPLSDVYRWSWESCLALWPLLVVRLVFVILNFGALSLCVFLVGWPFVLALWKGFKDSGNGDLTHFIETMDFSSFLPDAHWIFMAAGMALLFITWWSLLDALFDGAVYSSFRKEQLKETPFSLVEFFKDGLRFMGPMIGLQMVWFLIFSGVTLAAVVGALLVMLLLNILSFPFWIGILLAIPAGFCLILFYIGLSAFGVIAGAYLVEGKGVMGAVKRAAHKCIEGYGRAVWGLLLVWAVSIVFSIGFELVMGLFERIPYLGWLFIGFEFLVNLTLSIGIWVFMPALAVAFSLEKEA